MIVALLVTLASPVVAYAALRNAAMDLLGNVTDPSATLPPRSVVPSMKALMRAARRPEVKLPANARSIAEQAAVAVPLAYEPYYIAGRIEERAGRYRRATVLMEEARRRRPNATAVRIALLGYYGLANAYQKAIDEADQAMRINVRSRGLVLPAFAKLVAADAKARHAIAVALAKDPPWRDQFMEAAAAEKMKPEVAKALVEDIRRLRPGAPRPVEEAFLIRTLVGAGQFREARALWLQQGGREAPGGNAVFDPNFRGLAGLQPFAWSFHSGQEGTAEVARVKGDARPLLEVDYFGEALVTLASQVLSMPPGRYRLSTLVSGNSSDGDVRLSWKLLCLPANNVVGTLPLQPLAEELARKETVVTVPASGCQGQQLSLVGEPSEIPRTLRAQIGEVSIVLTTAPATRSRR